MPTSDLARSTPASTPPRAAEPVDVESLEAMWDAPPLNAAPASGTIGAFSRSWSSAELVVAALFLVLGIGTAALVTLSITSS